MTVRKDFEDFLAVLLVAAEGDNAHTRRLTKRNRTKLSIHRCRLEQSVQRLRTLVGDREEDLEALWSAMGSAYIIGSMCVDDPALAKIHVAPASAGRTAKKEKRQEIVAALAMAQLKLRPTLNARQITDSIRKEVERQSGKVGWGVIYRDVRGLTVRP
jgi:hypothetical protein